MFGGFELLIPAHVLGKPDSRRRPQKRIHPPLDREIITQGDRIPNIRIYEVGISYYGRTYEEGKKIGWKDGFRAIYCIIKYGLFKAK